MIESRLISAEEHVLEKSILTSKTKLSELQYLNKLDLVCSAFQSHLHALDFPNASDDCIQFESLIHSVNQKIEPSLFISLQKQGVELKSVLSNSLHQLIENCLGVSVDNLLYIIQLPRAIDSKVIKSYLPATAPYIQSKDVFLAARKISLETDYLSRFANLLLKDVIVPISKAKSLSMIIEEGFIEVRHDSYDSDSVNPIDCLTCIFKIISAYIHSSICDTTAMDTLSALIWDPMCKSIIENILEPNLPKELDDIEPFQQQFAAMCASFEADMTLIGLCRGEESGLQNYISSAYNILSEKKVRNHISNAKDIISSNSYDTIVLRNERHNDIKDNIHLEFPSCTIHESIQRLSSLIEDISVELYQSNELMIPKLIQTIRNILDLYRAKIMSNLYSANIGQLPPQILMIFHNDCMYIGHRCRTWLLDFKIQRESRANTIIDLAVHFQSLANKIFHIAIDQQKRILLDIIEQADGFDVEKQERYEQVKKTFSQINYQMRHLHSVWMEVLPTHMCFIALGRLVEVIVVQVIEEINKLDDISEEESKRLNEILSLDTIGTLFISNDSFSMMTHYSGPFCQKYKTLIELLNWSFSSIMEHFRIGALTDFSIDELIHLINALFSDTPLREKNIKELGHDQY
ncbi:Centromere/kinetochore Zw10-domain-containing protein [Globomyces pollinis-pini]|nr:Centromere/kinetochore Zw10-domain-containing protein [Globomyces pollinis-pini]